MSSEKKERIVKSDPKWEDYFKSLLTDSEVNNGHPTASGLRRVCELVYGHIIASGADIKHISDDRVVTQYTIHCVEYNSGEKIVQSALAEASKENTPEPYSLHLAASCETKSEGRALRKMLCLSCITAEEVATGETVEKIKEISIRAIKSSVKSKKIDLAKFIAKYTGLTEKHLDPNIMPRDLGNKLLNQLNEFENGVEIPTEILTEAV